MPIGPPLPDAGRRPRRGWAVLLIVTGLISGTAAAGCSTDQAADDGRLQVKASFYPLQWIAEQVGGRYIDVTSLTKAGAEPHDLELSPKDVGAIQDADLVVYLRGFQPAVDDALRDTGASQRFDAGPVARLSLVYTPIEDGERAQDESGSTDPHFWLDPTKLARVADALATTLSRQDPSNGASYAANARRVRAELAALDRTYRSTLAGCENRKLVTSHNAFGYLARRYGLQQVSVTGLTPEAEPTPRALAKISDLVRTQNVRTVYFETLVGEGIARTVAAEAGARTDVLDPIEGLNDRSQGRDYVEVMKANLDNLVKGQPCP